MDTLLGAGVSLGGLLLIFSGFVFAQAATMPATTSDRILDRYKRFARLGLVPFSAALLMAGLAECALIWNKVALETTVVIVFFLLLATTIAYGLAATRYL